MTVAINVQRAEQLTEKLRGGQRADHRSSTANTAPAWARPAANARAARADQRSRGQREELASGAARTQLTMLSAFVPQPQGLRASRTALRRGDSRRIDLARPGRAHAQRREAGRKFPQHRRPDARRDARDRSVEPALRRRRRALHDRHRGHQARLATCRRARRSRSSSRRPSWSRIATSDPLPFRRFIAYAERHPNSCNSPPAVLRGLRRVHRQPRRRRHRTRRPPTSTALRSKCSAPRGASAASIRDFRKMLERLGQNGELISKARESLVSLGRLLTFVQQSTVVPMSRGRPRRASAH